MTPSHTTNLYLRWCMLTLLVIMSLTGCVVPVPMPPATPTPTSVAGEVLPFETVVQTSTHCVTYDTEAKLFFVTTPEEFDQLLAQLPTPRGPSVQLENLPPVDFSRHAVIVVARTCQGYAAYDVQIDRVIRQEGDDIFVYAELRSPTPGHGMAAVEGSYVHIISIPWDGPGVDEIEMKLVTYVTYY